MARIIVFDVNETLLDLSALDPWFVRLFGDAGARRDWFSTVLLYSEVVTLAGPYTAFGDIGRAALDMIAAARGVKVTSADGAAIVAGMRSLPPHADVIPGLRRLRDQGLRLVTLTNSAPDAVRRQLASAGIDGFFERTFSVGAVQKFKPAAEVYLHAARELGVAPGRLRLVAAHAWDVYGAMRAGCAGAFVARPGQILYPLGPQPDIVGSDVMEVAGQIIEIETATPS